MLQDSVILTTDLKEACEGKDLIVFAVASPYVRATAKEAKPFIPEGQIIVNVAKGIEQAVVGHRLGDISYAVQQHCEAQGYGVVREFVGHGVGHEMHEDPQVPNYGRRGNGILLKSGLCIAIEPMITMGTKDIYMQEDRWGIVTRDKKPAAHYEHSLCVRKGKADILSSFDEIEKVLADKFI